MWLFERKMVIYFILSQILMASVPVYAGVVLLGTRIVFPGDQREVTIRLDNKGERPALVQAWLDQGQDNLSPEKISTPFTVTPPVARIDPAKGQILRLIYSGEQLPLDRESLYWFNMLDVPPKPQADGGHLQFAFRTRIKLFFRPKGLPGSPEAALKALHWSFDSSGKDYALKAINSSPYYLSFSDITLLANGRRYKLGGGMIAPMGELHFALQGWGAVGGEGYVEVNAINDYGGIISLKSPVSLR